jgi:endonuclease/exonuclease/phosphatase family metal-dependent hydrolase
VVAVIKTMNSDVVALQEVGTSSTYATIDTIVKRLGSDWQGRIVASGSDNCGQNQALIYKKSKVQLVSAAYITDGGSSYDWSSGRYPVLYSINLLVGGNVVPVSLINIHSKAMSDATSYSRRKNASLALKTLLDGSVYNTKKVVLLGDYNDYLTGTQCNSCSPAESPYKNFVDDTQNYKCLTGSLYDPAYSSPVIDNIIISNELIDNYKINSTKREETATQSISNYSSTTSDHVPVSATFSIQNGTTPTCTNLEVSETFAQSLGDFTTVSVTGSQLWGWKSIYGAVMTGYANAVNNINEDWLISPAYDLSGKSLATLTFNHALNCAATETDRMTNHTLWASLNYVNGALPSSVTWTQLTVPTMPSGSSWVYVNSGTVIVPAQLLQKDVRFAFKYQSNVTTAGTWEVKDFNLNAACVNTNVTAKSEVPKTKITVVGKRIKIDNEQLLPVSVFDITWRILFSAQPIQTVEIPVFQSGVYIVRSGNQVSKVLVE